MNSRSASQLCFVGFQLAHRQILSATIEVEIQLYIRFLMTTFLSSPITFMMRATSRLALIFRPNLSSTRHSLKEVLEIIL